MKLKKLVMILLALCMLCTACKKNAPASSGGATADTPAAEQLAWLPTTCDYNSITGSYQDIYRYDEQGNLIGFESRCNGELLYAASFSYDQAGLMVADLHIWYANAKVSTFRQCTYFYQENALITTETTVENADSSVITTYLCHYNTTGQPGQEQVFENEELICSTNYSYNDLDMLTKKILTHKDGTEQRYTYQYAYDPNGNVGLVTCMLDGAEQYRDSWLYLDDGKLSETTRYYPDTTYDRHIYTYNDDGNISLDTWHKPNDEIVEKRYTYTSITATPERAAQLAAQREALMN